MMDEALVSCIFHAIQFIIRLIMFISFKDEQYYIFRLIRQLFYNLTMNILLMLPITGNNTIS